MTRHKHYDLIVKWAENPDAWIVEFLRHNGSWVRISEGELVAWHGEYEYRLIPRTRTMRLGDLTFPEPLREASNDTEVWMVDIYRQPISGPFEFRDNDNDWHRHLLRLGLLHSTREAAEAHAKAMLTMVEVKP